MTLYAAVRFRSGLQAAALRTWRREEISRGLASAAAKQRLKERNALRKPKELKGFYPPYDPPARISLAPEDIPPLAHRRIEVFARPDTRSSLRRVRRASDWVPGFLQGRGLLPDVFLRVPLRPLLEDYMSGLFVLQQRGKVRFCGPLYELNMRPDPEGDGVQVVPDGPVRAQPMGMLVHPLSDKPLGVIFVPRPENRPVRVRVPIRYMNHEKCVGIRTGGWLNHLRRAVDINVAVNVRPPLKATHDLTGLQVTNRKTVGELVFDGKGQGCRTVLPDDELTTIISKL